MKSVGIVCAAIAAAVLAGSMFGYGSYKSMYNSSHNRKEIHKSLDWYNNNIGELNSLYEKRDYAGISELTDSYKGSSSVLEKWSHYNFLIFMIIIIKGWQTSTLWFIKAKTE